MIRSWIFLLSVVAVVPVALLGCSGTAAAAVPGAATGGPAVWSPVAASPEPPAPDVDRKSATARLTIPSIGVKDLRVVPYEGTADDWPGTRIQDRGLAAAPYGAHRGAGPGQIGNYLVTGHRLTAGGPLRAVPSMKKGDKVLVTTGGTTYTYTITETRKTDFRSARSRDEQQAAVPGFPGRKPTKPMITISTCATLEDNAAGNFWRDDRNNPQHRIDKVGVLTSRSNPHNGS